MFSLCASVAMQTDAVGMLRLCHKQLGSFSACYAYLALQRNSHDFYLYNAFPGMS